MAGVDLKTIQGLLDHQTFEMTLRYAHLSPPPQVCNLFLNYILKICIFRLGLDNLSSVYYNVH